MSDLQPPDIAGQAGSAVARSDARTRGIQQVLIDSGMGDEVALSDAKPGDFVQYWVQSQPGASWTGGHGIIERITGESDNRRVWLFGPHGNPPVVGLTPQNGLRFVASPDRRIYVARLVRTDRLESLHKQFERVVAGVKRADAGDPRLYFMDAQLDILDALANSPYFRQHPQDREWLGRITARFMTSFERSLAGAIAVKTGNKAHDTQQWQDVLEGKLGGFWWGEAFRSADELRTRFTPQPMPNPQLDEYYAAIFVIAHIAGDLHTALFAEGVGTDEAFAEIGNLVEHAWSKHSRYPRSLLEMASRANPLFAAIDPLVLRNKTRADVQASFQNRGLTDPRRGMARDALVDLVMNAAEGGGPH
jgi:hypothetical protein